MTENEIIDFLEDEINGLKEQKYGELGEIAAKVFKEINGDERIKVFRVAISALEEIQQYREIGTAEECREAVEKQKAKKCVEESCPDHMHYKCPSCGKVQKTKYGNSEFGCILNYCSNCGQAIDENLEGMEDG